MKSRNDVRPASTRCYRNSCTLECDSNSDRIMQVQRQECNSEEGGHLCSMPCKLVIHSFPYKASALCYTFSEFLSKTAKGCNLSAVYFFYTINHHMCLVTVLTQRLTFRAQKRYLDKYAIPQVYGKPNITRMTSVVRPTLATLLSQMGTTQPTDRWVSQSDKLQGWNETSFLWSVVSAVGFIWFTSLEVLPLIGRCSGGGNRTDFHAPKRQNPFSYTHWLDNSFTDAKLILS